MVLGKERRQLLAVGGILTLLASVLELPRIPEASAAAKPDLVVASVSRVPASVEQGDRFAVTVKVKNAGSRKAKPSSVRFYLSGDAAKDSLDIRLSGQRRVPSLKPGRASRGKTGLVVPVSAPLDTLLLLACADDKKKVGEANDRNNCRAAAEVEVVEPVTSYDLIDQAMAGGEIDEETGLLYKVYRDFDDPRLPARFLGNDAGVRESNSLEEATAIWDNLLAQTQAALAPFFVLPIYEESWFFDQPGQSESPLRTRLDDPEPDLCNLAAAWDSFTSANGKVRVWYQTRYGESESIQAEALAGVINDTIWPNLTGLVGEPLPDEGSTKPCRGTDDRLDIMLLNFFFPGQMNPYGACDKGPGYIYVDRDYAGGEVAASTTHEIMHAIQWSYDVSGCLSSEYSWLMEATATWAEDYVFPTGQSEQGYADSYLNNPRISLNEDVGLHAYGAYLLPFFLAGEGRVNAGVVKRIWDNTKTMKSLDAVDAAMPGGFVDGWKEFVLYNWNSPPVDSYRKWDELYLGAPPDGLDVQRVSVGRGSEKTVNVPAGVPHLAARYRSYEFKRNVRQVRFDNDLAGNGDADVQAIVVLADGSKRVEDWSDASQKQFCRDNKAEDVKYLTVVVSNHSKSAVLPDTAGKLVARNSCSDAPDHYDATFSGFSAFGDTWSGAATFDLIGPASNCDVPEDPPTPDELEYCYQLAEGTAQWQYESSQVTANLTPETDFGKIVLHIKDPDPDRVRTYQVGLLALEGGHCIPADGVCRDASWAVNAWIATGGGLAYIGDGWQLVRSVTACAPEEPSACQGWTYDFQPRWDSGAWRGARELASEHPSWVRLPLGWLHAPDRKSADRHA